MTLTHYDNVNHEGRTFLRYQIHQLNDLNGSDDQPLPGPGGEPLPTAQRTPLSKFAESEHYSAFVDICRRWWIFKQHTLHVWCILDLIQEFNLLPDFASFYPTRPQQRELAKILNDVVGFEFDGFVIQPACWAEYHPSGLGETSYAYTLIRLNGFSQPPILSSPDDPIEREAWVKEFQWTERYTAWLLGQ